MKMKKLNRKGFTLIELLAVIVILAVVMGVAATSVLSAMNNSRKSSLQNSAATAADAFRAAYAENMLTNTSSALGLNIVNGYNALTADTFSKLNISTSNYVVGGVDGSGKYTGSFAWFNSTDGSFIVCLAADPSGSYNVPDAAKKVATGITGAEYSSGVMFACSNGQHSWNDQFKNFDFLFGNLFLLVKLVYNQYGVMI